DRSESAEQPSLRDRTAQFLSTNSARLYDSFQSAILTKTRITRSRTMSAAATARRSNRNQAKLRDEGHSISNGYCLRTYGDAYTGATPRALSLPSGPLWVVPVMFTSAGYGPVGEVGVVAIDPQTLQVLDATPKHEVRAAGARLAREKRDDLHAAFR